MDSRHYQYKLPMTFAFVSAALFLAAANPVLAKGEHGPTPIPTGSSTKSVSTEASVSTTDETNASPLSEFFTQKQKVELPPRVKDKCLDLNYKRQALEQSRRDLAERHHQGGDGWSLSVMDAVTRLNMIVIGAQPYHSTVKQNKIPIESRVCGIALTRLPTSDAYLALVKQRISSSWSAPPVDVTDQTYVVIVQFRLHRNGRVSRVAIEQSSGNEYFDLAGKRAVLSAVPLPSFPAEITDAYVDSHFTFAVGPTK